MLKIGKEKKNNNNNRNEHPHEFSILTVDILQRNQSSFQADAKCT